jgi:hypothetical protein
MDFPLPTIKQGDDTALLQVAGTKPTSRSQVAALPPAPFRIVSALPSPGEEEFWRMKNAAIAAYRALLRL